MFIWIAGFLAMATITGIFGYTGAEASSTGMALFLFKVFSTAFIVSGVWALAHRRDSIIGHTLRNH